MLEPGAGGGHLNIHNDNGILASDY